MSSRLLSHRRTERRRTGSSLRSGVPGAARPCSSRCAKCHQILDGFSGDRVVAIFGDGDLGPREAVLAKVAQMKAEDIRFVTRGLGPVAVHAYAEVSSEDPADVEVCDVEDLAAGIAGMAASLKSRSGPP